MKKLSPAKPIALRGFPFWDCTHSAISNELAALYPVLSISSTCKAAITVALSHDILEWKGNEEELARNRWSFN